VVIIHGGLPRAGTVLVGTIALAILDRQGAPWQREAPQERRHMPAFAAAVRGWQGPGALLVHTHLADGTVLAALSARPDRAVFWNLRDPRDALVSLMQLHDLTLDRALHAMEVYAAVAERVVASGLAIVLRYEALIADRRAAIRRIAGAMGADLPAPEVERIAARTSPDAHRAVMQAVADGRLPTIAEHRTKTRTLREDSRTLINDRHIQSGAVGRWRTELSPTALGEAEGRLGRWIDAFGYGGAGHG